MSTLLTNADCPSVRASIDISTSAEMLPDDTILLDIFAGIAEREVRSKVPDIDTRSSSDVQRLRTAAVYYTAANIIKSVPQMISENIGGYHYQIKSSDPNQRYTDLRAMGDGEIQGVLYPNDDTPNRPVTFTLVSGQRGI